MAKWPIHFISGKLFQKRPNGNHANFFPYKHLGFQQLYDRNRSDSSTATGGLRYMRTFYLRFQVYAIEEVVFSGTYPLIYGNPWCFYMQIHYIRAYF